MDLFIFESIIEILYNNKSSIFEAVQWRTASAWNPKAYICK